MKPNTSRKLLYGMITASSSIGGAAVVSGAIGSVAGVAMPWAQASLFNSVTVPLPGIFFAFGGITAACGAAALAFRKSPFICLPLGITIAIAASLAGSTIPHTVRGLLLGAQVSIAPINRLLDQFHIDNVTVGDYGAKDSTFLGDGIQWSLRAGELIVLGSLLKLPTNDGVVRLRRHLMHLRCSQCGASWRLERDVRYCPVCATPTELAQSYCRHCGATREPTDRFCIKCGKEASRNLDPAF